MPSPAEECILNRRGVGQLNLDDAELASLNIQPCPLKNEAGKYSFDKRLAKCETTRLLIDPRPRLGHLRYMIQRLQSDEAKGWSLRKTNRWLGFIQGVLWSTYLRGLKDLRKENNGK